MIIGIIPAKGKSKRLANKNMKIINNKPMINYTFEYAKKSKILNDIYVSTEDKTIAEHCIKNKIKVIERPENLCDETPLIEVYKHAFQILKNINIEILVGLQADHPDRKLGLDITLSNFIEKKADFLFSTELNGTKNGAHYILSKKI